MNGRIVIKKLIAEQAPYALLYLADPSPKRVNNYINKGDVYVASKEQEVVGVYVLLLINFYTIELINLAVAEKYQNNGIGKLLINHSIQTAKKSGYKTIEVGTGNSSINQIALYQKCGFSIASLELDFFSKNYENPIYENGIPCKHMIRFKRSL